jgi:chromosome segregation ATPase
VAVGPGQTEKVQIEEYHPEESEYELDDLDDDRVALIVQNTKVSPALQDIFHRVLELKNQVSSLEAQSKTRQQEVDAITRDQSRVRENMKALKGTAEEKALLQRYTRQLDSQEDRLNTLNREISDLEQKHTQAEEQLDQMVQQITLDESL